MGFCSAVTLAFATIFSLVAAALLAIAFSTDNWVTIKVEREELKIQLLQVITSSVSRPPACLLVSTLGNLFNNVACKALTIMSLSTANCAILTI